MSVVGGTQGYKSGQILFVSEGVCCDNHPDKPATQRVVGEVDQYGYEASDFCEDCFRIYEQLKATANVVCDWCGCQSNHFRPMMTVDNLVKDTIDKVCDICVGKHVHNTVEKMQEEEEAVEEDHGVECYVDNEDEDYRYKEEPQDDIRPLNFNTSRW